MEEYNDDGGLNSYMALRKAKIARNQARLKELGLFKFPKATRSNTPLVRKKKQFTAVAQPSRRSARISGQPIKTSYLESKNLPNYLKTQCGAKLSLEVTENHEMIYTNSYNKQFKKIASKSPSEPAANSVRSISLDISKLVLKFLGKPLETFGKDFVIQNTFREAAYPEDMQRLQGASRLSFNKYSGVQEWKNVIYLWINIGGQNSVVNDFSQNGSRVSWYGGSKMREDSPVIQRLIHMGKEIDSRIILWCRHYDMETKKLLPYTCLGRLAYENNVSGSQPVAFTWRLIDYELIISSQTTREFFQKITGSG